MQSYSSMLQASTRIFLFMDLELLSALGLDGPCLLAGGEVLTQLITLGLTHREQPRRHAKFVRILPQ